MSIALRERSSSLTRRAFDLLPCLYIVFGVVGIASVIFACFQAAGFSFWPTYQDGYTGLFYSPITQGGFLGLTIVALARHWWLPMPILVLGLYLNTNRGGWVVAGAGLLATFIRKPLVILVVVLIGALLITAHPRLADLERFNIWQMGWINLTWFGHGWGSFADVWIVKNGLGYWPEHAHNDYLEFAFEFGIYTIPFFCLLVFALSRSESPDWPLLVAFCTMALFAMPSFIPATASIGALALASVLTEGVYNGKVEST